MSETYSIQSQATAQSSAASVKKAELVTSSWMLLALMVALSLVIRIVAWMYFGTGTIESEGAEYAKIAENLRNGVGFVGLVVPGPQIHFPPLYSLLIAGASRLTGDYETAGRLVSLILGALLPLPVFGITLRLFNRPVAIIAGVLSLLHPLTIYLSFMVLSEGPYATLLLSAVYLVIRALDDSSNRLWPLIGAAFGVCYLLRAEALGAFAISVVFGLIIKGSSLDKGKRAVGAVVVLLLFALPVSVFIYRSTGRIMLEAKSTSISYLDSRVLAAERTPGVDFVSGRGFHDVPSPAHSADGTLPWEIMWAYYSITPNLEETGFAMRPWVETVRDEKTNLRDVFPLLLAGVRNAIPQLFRQFSSLWLGAPLLPALALLGAFRRPWRRPQALLRAYFTLVTFAPLAATLFIFWGDNPRYYFIFVPVFSIWAANGLFEIGLWAKASMLAAGWDRLDRQRPYHWILPAFLGLVTVTSPIKATLANFEFSSSALPMRVDKEVGLWIARQESNPIRVMDLTLPLSFHADAQRHVYFPYTTGELALRYLDATKVDYIVLRRGEKYTKYYEEWLEKGIPSPRAERLRLPLSGAEKFVIYRWHHTEP
jgi:4-amino-4-deoxy-L-arabinose transferase-like glycosyltransferase